MEPEKDIPEFSASSNGPQMMQKEKSDFVQEMNLEYQQIKNRFAPVQESVLAHQMGDELEEKYNKLSDCIKLLKWRINHFAENHASLGEIVETAFDDILDEIEWRFKEVELCLRGKDISDEDQEKQIAHNFARKSEH
jgi:hypothetical protein